MKRLLLFVSALALAVGGSTGAAALGGSSWPSHHQLPGWAHSPRPDRPVKMTMSPDGCDHDYGTADQCVPYRAPGNKPMTCAYLATLGLLSPPLAVHRDSLGLDRRHDGIACN